jgi:hypothetical protein
MARTTAFLHEFIDELFYKSNSFKTRLTRNAANGMDQKVEPRCTAGDEPLDIERRTD